MFSILHEGFKCCQNKKWVKELNNLFMVSKTFYIYVGNHVALVHAIGRTSNQVDGNCQKRFNI